MTATRHSHDPASLLRKLIAKAASRHASKQVKTPEWLMLAYPEAGTDDSHPQEGRSPAGIVSLKNQGSHHIDDAMPTAHMHYMLL